MVMHDGGLEGVDEGGVKLVGEVEEHVFIDQEPVLAVGHLEEPALEALKIHADAGGQAAEEEATGTNDAPEFGNHRLKLGFASSEVEDGVADDDVGKVIWKRHFDAR